LAIVVGLTVLAVTWAMWRAVQSDSREGCHVRRDAIAGFTVGTVIGGGLEFFVSILWFIYGVPPAINDAGGTWLALASPLQHRLLPAIGFLVGWVAFIAVTIRPDTVIPNARPSGKHPPDMVAE
jgi:hypothetical protein